MVAENPFEIGLERNPANFLPLSPLSFLDRAARVHPERTSIVHGERRFNWQTTAQRCRRLASALYGLGIRKADTVAVMLPNVPAMVEAHFGVPMLGAVLNTLNTRLDATTIAFMLGHGQARIVLVDPEFVPTVRAALDLMTGPLPLLIDVDDETFEPPRPEAASGRDPDQPRAADRLGQIEYEELLSGGDPDFVWSLPTDEWDAICLNYTSGTTGNPKGVVYHHRGAYLNAVSNLVDWSMPAHSAYLWTLPMFHCNGWCFPWTVTLNAGVHVCLRKVDPALIFDLIRRHRVTHLCGAPIVYSMLIHAPAEERSGIDWPLEGLVAGAAPPLAILEGCERAGIRITHVYGLTETYGPAAVCEKKSEWDTMPLEERARLNGRQGVPYHLQENITVLDPETMAPVPADGETMGELFFRGNIVMKGYLKNPTATAEAFAGGWFHTGDLAVLHPDGYVKIKDRSKDIIISGGENISSLEVEDCLYKHPAVLTAAVVSRPDPKWGEVPVAFLELKPGLMATELEIITWCRDHLARFKVPKSVIFGTIPKTSTGKLQKYVLRRLMHSADAIE